jgi:hypothetical protein
MFCGTRLAPDAEHGLKLDPDLALIDCGACKRTARYKADVLNGSPAPEPAAPAQRKTAARKPAAGKTAAGKAAAKPAGSEHEGDGGRQAPSKPAAKKRPTRASRNAELSAAAKAARDADGAAVKARDEVTGELTWRLIEGGGVDALVEAAEAATGEAL